MCCKSSEERGAMVNLSQDAQDCHNFIFVDLVTLKSMITNAFRGVSQDAQVKSGKTL